MEIIAVSGEWDFTIAFIAKNTIEIAEISNDIKIKYGKFIEGWSESLTTGVYRFEKYDMLKIMGYQ